MLAQHRMDHVARTWCLPSMLLLNFGCFQYLVLLFRVRWREPRVVLLLLLAAVGTAVLIPFATQDDGMVSRLNDVSESCLALLLLVQTVLVGSKYSQGPIRTASKAVQIAADLVVLFDCVVAVLGIVAVFRPSITSELGGATMMNNVAEGLTLAFTFVCRFGLLAKTKKGGWRALLREDNWELFWHLVLVTHEYVFMLLEWQTGISWEFVQAIYMRLSILPCVWMAIGDHHNFHIVRSTLNKIASRHSMVVDAIPVAKNDTGTGESNIHSPVLAASSASSGTMESCIMAPKFLPVEPLPVATSQVQADISGIARAKN